MSNPDQFSCLIVDDDAGFISMLAKVVSQEGGQVSQCADLKSARAETEHRAYDLVLLDNRLPDGTGYEFFQQLNRRCPDTVVVMVTGVPELTQAVELTRNGLFDYLTKPLNVADFTNCLRRVRQRLSHPDRAEMAGELIGDSPALREALNSLQQAARHTETTVLLLGETGTGKDLAARLLHRLTYAGRPQNVTSDAGQVAGEVTSDQWPAAANPVTRHLSPVTREPPYVPLNCSAVPAEMFESELFGSEKGAFTGADKRREGLIEAAAGGTLFLDEITDTPMPQQGKLLRFLESREYRPLGSNTLRQFTGRIVAATNRSLADEVKRGRFREDLMFRLTVATVRLPSLREHISDLEALVEHLLAKLCQKYRRKKPFLKPGDLEALRGYHFPGNTRELRNLLERALLRTADDASWLAFDLAWISGAPGGEAAVVSGGSFPPPPPGRQLNAIDLQEYRLIQQALQAEGGGIRRAATRLGITHQALLRRLEKWPELRQVTSN